MMHWVTMAVMATTTAMPTSKCHAHGDSLRHKTQQGRYIRMTVVRQLSRRGTGYSLPDVLIGKKIY